MDERDGSVQWYCRPSCIQHGVWSDIPRIIRNMSWISLRRDRINTYFVVASSAKRSEETGGTGLRVKVRKNEDEDENGNENERRSYQDHL